MYPAFIKKLGLTIQFTNVGAQKIDGTIFGTYKIVVAVLSVSNQVKIVIFFENTF